MLTYADVCLRMLTHCASKLYTSNIQESAFCRPAKARRLLVCSRMLTYAHVCAFCRTAKARRDLAPWSDAGVETRQVYAHVCSRMLAYADICWRMLTYAAVCCRMLPYAVVCCRMLTRMYGVETRHGQDAYASSQLLDLGMCEVYADVC